MYVLVKYLLFHFWFRLLGGCGVGGW